MSDRMIRINRYLSGSGLGSRRKCEKYVLDGKVRVNDEMVTDLAFKVNPLEDRVTVSGKPVAYIRNRTVLVMNKPPGVICSVSDNLGRKTVIDIARENGYSQRLYPVGRLDIDTTGILLLTNDGTLTNRLIHPRYHVDKTYTARVDGKVTEETAAELAAGVDIGGYVTSPCSVRVIRAGEKHSDVEIRIKEGKKRQIKRMFLSRGHSVIKLHRSSVAGLKFNDLEKGQIRPLKNEEEKHLRKKVGLA
ncbi:MAG: pseudouridine synthase [Candidatus Krumholzibacteriales bacterium]